MKNILLFIHLLLPFVVFSQPGNSISPSSANAGQTLNVTIIATNPTFTQGANLTVTIGGIVSNSVTVINDITIEANISIPANTYTNDYHVIVNQLNVGPLLVVNVFHINGIALPLLTSVSPSVATNGQTLDIMLTGKNTHFISSGVATKVWIDFGFSVGTEANSVTPINDTLIKANITVPVYIYDGYYTVSCYNSFNGSLSWPGTFQVTGNPRPKIAVNPASGVAGRTLDLTILGTHTHFKSNKIAVNFGFNSTNGGSVINTIKVLTDTTIKVNITIPASTSPSDYGVSVSDSNNTSTVIGNCSFHVYSAQDPLIIDVNPKSAVTKQTLDVTITGLNTHFTSAGTVFSIGYMGGGTAIINSVNVVNDSSAVLNITIPRYVHAGDYPVIVDNVADGQLFISNGFHIYEAPIPEISSIDPAIADAGQTLDVTIKGSRTHFTDNGTKVVFYFSQKSGTIKDFVNSVNVLNDSILIANITIPADVYSKKYAYSVDNTTDDQVYGFNFEVKNGIPAGIFSHDTDEHFISVHPNPADNLITILSSTPISALNKPVLSIYSIEGKLLLQQAFVKEKMTLDVSAFRKGIYIMQLTGSQQTEIIKFAKE